MLGKLGVCACGYEENELWSFKLGKLRVCARGYEENEIWSKMIDLD